MQNGDRLERLRDLSPAKRALLLKKLAQQAQNTITAPTIRPRQQSGPAVLSFAQQQLFYLYLLEPQSSAYNVPVVLRLLGALNQDALLESLQTLIQRHEILRTTIQLRDGEPLQVVAPTAVLVPQMIDASASVEAEQVQLIADEVSIPFDLAQGPLLRVALLKVGATEHVLVCTLHHIITDGWSIGILFRELETLYQALAQRKSVQLPAPTLQYADYALWQRSWLRGAVLEEQLTYWRQHLAGVATFLELPTDYPRPDVQRYQGATLSFHIPEALRAALLRLSQAEGTTLFMTLLAAFQALLYRYSGQADFLLGTPVANRTHKEMEDLPGCFINTLVLRSHLAANPSFRVLLQRVREECLEAYAHQEVPFEQLVEMLQPERNPGYNPLFQVMFVLQNAADLSLELPGLQVQSLDVSGQSAMFDLTLSLTEHVHGIEGVLEYNRELFSRVTLEKLQGHLLTLLQACVATPDCRLADLPLLTAPEMQYLLHEVNQPSAPLAAVPCLHQLFEAQVELTPEAPALVSGTRSLTYRELNLRATALAVRLRALGVGPEVLVGICALRSLELVVGLLAILKAGGAYVPLDPAYPAERLAFILEDTRASVLLTQRAVRERVAAYAGQVLWLDGLADPDAVLKDAAVLPSLVLSAAHLAYMIYTSGSTGRPKGVAITHASAAALVRWARNVYTPEELQGVLASTSICFDLSVFELFVPLSTGGCSILVDHALQLGRLPNRQQVTLVNTVPSIARELLRLPGFPSSVRTINLAGEALALNLVRDLYAQTSASRVFNLYGPSEDTTYSTFALIPPTITTPPALGRPVAGSRLYVLDRSLHLVPAGLPGEIYLAGEGLARGYLQRPELTAERFLPDPFSTEPGARLYKTGDLARYQADGSLEFLGRLDHQIKLRGFRIELGEIEAVLSRLPGVHTCLVLVQEDEAGERHLTAFVLPQAEQQLDGEELRTALQKQLPTYMVPSTFLLLAAFPLTPNGKVDRQALALLRQRSTLKAHAFQGPRDLLELRLVHLWEQVLQKSPVGVLDTFFELGGHSLLALQLVARIQQEFACNLALSALIQQGTIEHIAHVIRTGSQTLQQSSLVPLQTAGEAPPFFCVHPAGGNVLCYVELARLLERPFYGLQAEGLCTEEVPLRSVEEMAAHYLVALRSAQPQGPYYLGGWSLGGSIAFEMAQQLLAQGEEIAALVLVDSLLPASHIGSQELSQSEMLAGFALHLGLSQEQFEAAHAPFMTQSWNEQWQALIEHLRASGVIPADSAALYLQRLFQVYQATIQAWLCYQPRPYTGPLLLLRASERSGREDEEVTMGWRQIAGQHLTVGEVPGDHYTLMRQPHVMVLAARLRAALEAALQTRQRAPV